MQIRRRLGPAMAAWLCFAASSAVAQDSFVAEIVHKANARERDLGACAAARWPPGTFDRLCDFFERAVVGSTQVVTFDDVQCSYQRVERVYRGPHGKCVQYKFWVCDRGDACATGRTTYCMTAEGAWQRIRR